VSKPNLVGDPVHEQASVSMELLLPLALEHQLHSGLAMAGESEGYLSINDLVVEAIHQEIRQLHHSYSTNIPCPNGPL
jgi:hypothetical protein